MGLLEDLLAGMLQGQGQAQAPGQQPARPQINQNQLGGLLQAIVAMLNDPRMGGLEGLIKRFQEAGLGDVISSWIGTGQNRPIHPAQLERMFPTEVDADVAAGRLAAAAGRLDPGADTAAAHRSAHAARPGAAAEPDGRPRRASC